MRVRRARADRCCMRLVVSTDDGMGVCPPRLEQHQRVIDLREHPPVVGSLHGPQNAGAIREH